MLLIYHNDLTILPMMTKLFPTNIHTIYNHINTYNTHFFWTHMQCAANIKVMLKKRMNTRYSLLYYYTKFFHILLLYTHIYIYIFIYKLWFLSSVTIIILLTIINLISLPSCFTQTSSLIPHHSPFPFTFTFFFYFTSSICTEEDNWAVVS